MTQRDAQNPPQPDDNSIEEEHEKLYLDEQGLREIVEQWKSAPSLTLLRSFIADFRQALGNPAYDLYANGGNGSYVAFSRKHFFAELDQIAASLTLERAIYYVERLIKEISEVRTSPINDINLNRWKEYDDIYTDSLWHIERRDGSGAHTAGYWGNFIPQIPYQMMRRYTKKNEWVLDTFAGSGTTLIEGQRLGRNTIGIELQERMVEYTRKLVAAEPDKYNVTVEIVRGDSTMIDYKTLLERYGQQSVQLAIMHPPYFDIIKFSDDPRDLSNASSIDHFLEMVGAVVDNIVQVLDKGRYLIVVIGDKYARGDWIPLGFQTMNVILNKGFTLKSIIVKNFEDTSGKRNQKELWRYRALVGGFYIFKHEYIFVFRKKVYSKVQKD